MECNCLHCQTFNSAKGQISEPFELIDENTAFLDHPKTHESFDGDDLPEGLRLDLSCLPYFTESKVKVEIPQGKLYRIEYEHETQYFWSPVTTVHKPPVPSGQMETGKLSNKSANLLMRAGRLWQIDKVCPIMITLSYSRSVCQKISKRHLDTFLKRLKRLDDCEYFWVAEIQEKRMERTGIGVIHYHLCVDANYVPVRWLVNSWREITGQMNLQPDLQKVQNCGNYFAKYLSKGSKLLKPMPIVGKRAGFSRKLRKRLRAVDACTLPMSHAEAMEFLGGDYIGTKAQNFEFIRNGLVIRHF